MSIVLHIFNYRKNSGAQNPLLLLKGIGPVLKLSTCMRHIYVCPDTAVVRERIGHLMDLKDETYYAEQVELYDRERAYPFLLYWMVAGLTPKHHFSDRRILGDVRKTWTQICERAKHMPSFKAIKTQFESLILSLFIDSRGVWRGIDELRVNDPDLVQEACQRVNNLRERGVLDKLKRFDYRTAFQPIEAYYRSLEADLTQLNQLLLVQKERIDRRLLRSSLLEAEAFNPYKASLPFVHLFFKQKAVQRYMCEAVLEENEEEKLAL